MRVIFLIDVASSDEVFKDGFWSRTNLWDFLKIVSTNTTIKTGIPDRKILVWDIWNTTAVIRLMRTTRIGKSWLHVNTFYFLSTNVMSVKIWSFSFKNFDPCSLFRRTYVVMLLMLSVVPEFSFLEKSLGSFIEFENFSALFNEMKFVNEII